MRGGRFATALVPALVLHVAPSAAAQEKTALWRANVDVLGSWYREPLTGFLGQPGYVETFGAGLGYTLNSSRTQLAFDARGAGVLVQGTTQANHIDYVGAVSLSRIATPRVTMRFSEAVASLYTNGTPFLATNGLLFPLTLTRTNNLTADLVYKLSTTMDFTLSARHDWVGFGDTTPGLTSGWQLGTGATIDRQVTSTDTVRLSYLYRYNYFDNPTSPNADINTLSAGWTRRVKAVLAVSAAAGISRIHRADSSYQDAFSGDLTLTREFRTSNLSLRYSHGIDQAFGLGRSRVFDTAGLVYARQLSRTLDATLQGIYGRTRDPFDPLFGFDTQNYSLWLHEALGRQWSLGAGYAWLYRGALNGPTQSTSNLNASLSYGWQWR